jgi:plastocyanin
MRRGKVRILLMLASAGAAVLGPWAAPVTAGGGCHRGLTQGEGDTVEMAKMCFTPSILEVEPGTKVTFVNEDPMIHNVSANGWGNAEDMLRGDSFTATFADEGTYPFACSYHLGMTGAVVVGDGSGVGSGATVAVGPAEPTAGAQPRAAAPARVTTTGSAMGWILGALIGIVLGGGVGLALGRRRAA